MRDKDDLVNPKPSYSNLKHNMEKVIVGVRGKEQKSEIIVAKEDYLKILKFF